MNNTTWTRITPTEADTLALDWRGDSTYPFFQEHLDLAGSDVFLWSDQTFFAIRISAKRGNTPQDTIYAFHCAGADLYIDAGDTCDLDPDTAEFYGIEIENAYN